VGFNINQTRLGKLLLAFILIGILALTGCTPPPIGWSGPLVADDILYLGTLEGKLLTLDLADNHRQKWVFSPVDENVDGFYFYGNPVVAMVADGEVEEPVVYIGAYNGYMYAFDDDSVDRGMPKWRTPLGSPRSPIVGGPAIDLDTSTVFVGTSEGILYALNTENGSIRWNYPAEGHLEGKIWSSPVFDSGVVYFGCFDHKLYALDAVSGELKWEPFEAHGAIGSTPIVYGDAVYFGSFDHRFYAINKETGVPKWEVPFKADNWFWTEAIVSGGIIYVGSLDNKVYALDAEDGHKVREFLTEGPINSSPVIVEIEDDKILVVGSGEGDGKVYGFNTDTGAEMWAMPFDVEAAIQAPLCAYNGTVYVYGRNGSIYAVDVQNGGGALVYQTNQ